MARAVQAAGGGGGKGDAHTRGMLFCGTGIGVGIIANKFTGESTHAFWQVHHCKNYNNTIDVPLQGVAAVTAENEAAARASRSINDSNVLCMGGLVTTPEDAIAIAEAWLEQEHQRPPVAAGEADPAWWSPEVEKFLSAKWTEIHNIEKGVLSMPPAPLPQR